MFSFYCFSHHYILEYSSQIFGFATPVILFFWFCYTQYQRYLRDYCKEIVGVYAGFVQSSRNVPDKKGLQAGIIMYIRDIDNKGFFRGEIEYGETKLTFQNPIPISRPISAGNHKFLGKLDYKFYWDKVRNPLKPEQNRVYKGRLYVIVRFDFLFETQKIEEFQKAVYKIVYYREMKVLKFTLIESFKESGQKLPEEFMLYKSGGFAFEPLEGVTDIVFNPLNRPKDEQ